MSNRFSILYTHQKTKKRKVWQDGFLVKKEDSNTVVVYDENNYPITSFMRNKKQVLATGEEFECPKYLIQVEDLTPLVKRKENCMNNEKENMIESERNFQHEENTNNRTVPVFKPQKRKFAVPGANGQSGVEVRKFKKPFCAPKKLDQDISKNNIEMNEVQPGIIPETSKSMENKRPASHTSAKSIFTIVDDLDISMDDIDIPTFTNDDKSVKNEATVSRRRTMEVLELLNNSITASSKTTPPSNISITEVPQTLNPPNPPLLKTQTPLNPSSSIIVVNASKPSYSWKVPQQNNSLQNRFLKDLFFPSKADVNNGEKVGREAIIPTSFTNVKSYCDSLIKATQEYLNLLLYNLSKTYHDALEKVEIESYMTSRNEVYKRSGNPKGNYSTRMSNVRQIQSYLKRNKISMYCECTLVRRADVYRSDPKLASWLKRSQKFNQFSDVKKKTYIQLPYKEKSSVYNKNDIWVISDSLNFESNATFIAKSTWYGPSSENLVEIDCMSNYVSSKWTNGATIYAIHAGNASTELNSIKNIERNVNEKQFPLLPHLLSNFESENTGNGNTNTNSSRPVDLYQNTGIMARDLLRKKSAPLLNLNTTEVERLLDQFVEKYHLNSGQRDALSSAADMLCSKAKKKSPIVLVHGVFGSGKSFLLSVIILFLSEVAKLQPEFDWKILLSSTTNVAVDRVLNCLLDAGFTDICRIGSFKKISHTILPYSVHTKDKNEQIKELQSMLADKENSQQQRVLIKKSLDQVRRGITEQLLTKAIVVGATCAATTFPYLQSYKFPIVIVDECTQSTEPHILLPLAPFSCQYVLLVGDPNQLPPTIDGAPAKHWNGLEQTMFNRLQLMKYEAVKLRTQYRCHPDISKLANELFYDKSLIDGVDVSKRVKILPKLNHLVLFDTSDGTERRNDFTGSFYNERESTFICEVIKTLLENGVPGFQIGVIALYRAQVFKIKESLENLELDDKSDLSCIQVSTVDAFQGAEKEIIILSCVRSTPNNFVNVKERMCVALTRAKVHLLIVGHLKNLKKCENWDKVVKLCENNIQTPFQFRKIWKKK